MNGKFEFMNGKKQSKISKITPPTEANAQPEDHPPQKQPSLLQTMLLIAFSNAGTNLDLHRLS